MSGELIDTNILVYAYDSSDSEKHRISKDIIRKIWVDGGGVTTVQNLTEFFVVITKKIQHPLSINQAKIIINDIFHSKMWAVYDRDVFTLSRAMDLITKCDIHLWDALIAQVMLDNNISCILTENLRDFCKVPNLKSVNPFIN